MDVFDFGYSFNIFHNNAMKPV